MVTTHIIVLVTAGLIACPAWAQPREWSDDFTTAATYDDVSLNAPCSGGPSTKYTLIEGLTADTFNDHAVSGGGVTEVSIDRQSDTEVVESLHVGVE